MLSNTCAAKTTAKNLVLVACVVVGMVACEQELAEKKGFGKSLL